MRRIREGMKWLVVFTSENWNICGGLMAYRNLSIPFWAVAVVGQSSAAAGFSLQEQTAVEGQVVVPFLCQHLLCQYKQMGRAFIVINRDLALIPFDLKLCGCFPRDGLYLSWVWRMLFRASYPCYFGFCCQNFLTSHECVSFCFELYSGFSTALSPPRWTVSTCKLCSRVAGQWGLGCLIAQLPAHLRRNY